MGVVEERRSREGEGERDSNPLTALQPKGLSD
jgi:hypothetical protein